MKTSGKVFWEDDGTPVGSGYKVELWDADPGRDDFVGMAMTDAGGEYSISQKRRQDPWWYGKKKRRGDLYIKVFEAAGNTYRRVFQSKVYKDYSADALTVDVPLSKIAVEHGVNTVYGTIVAKYPDGSTHRLERAKVVVNDYDLIEDDKLGECVVGSDGKFFVTFKESDYRASWNPFEGKPDVFVTVYMYDPRGDSRRIWRTRTFREATLPLRIDVEVPVIHISGEVKSYHKCVDPENPDLEAKPITDLVAKAWDLDLLSALDFLGECAVDIKAGVGSFNIYVYGTSGDPGDVSEIYVELRDKNDGHRAWRSPENKKVIPPTHIEVNEGNPIEATDRCWEPVAEPVEPPSGAGTRLIITNRALEERYIYKEAFNTPEVFITALAPNGRATVDIKCQEAALVRAKRESSASFSSVTYEVGIVGACLEEWLEIADDIWR